MTAAGYLHDLRLLLGGSGRALRLALLLSVLSAALDLISMLLLPVIVGWALTAGTRAPPGGLALVVPRELGVDPLLAVALAVVGLFTLRAGLAILLGAYLSHLGQHIRERVSRRVISGYLQAPFLDSLQRSVSECVATVTSHTNHFSNSVVIPLLRLGTDLLTIVILLGFLAWLAPLPTAGVALVLGATALLYAAVVRRSSEKHSRRVASLERVFHGQVSQALQGGREVRVYGAQDYFSSEISRTLYALAHSQARLGAIYWLPRALGELVLILIAVGYMAFTIGRGHSEAMVVSNLSALAFAGMRLLPAFAQSMVGVSMLRAGRAVTEILAAEMRRTAKHVADRTAEPASLPLGQAIETLELDSIRFGYTPSTPILDGVNLRIQRGQSVGLIGRSGAGKSTLGDIVLGLLDPQSGTIRVNGQIRGLNNSDWWSRVGFVPQNPFIANESLARNIAYGQPEQEIDQERLWNSIEAAQLAPLVRSWPEGVKMRLGDQGVKLSGGQRQRVAIARALYRQRELLVLDEATSALDPQTEKEVIQALGALHGKVTTLVIAHRLSTLEYCDFIAEVQQGQLTVLGDRQGKRSQPGST
ncbi:MAG: ABC transporter ATP-binding protein [Stagnimonas sp.]|nr:ABC transporter ATP-binding protein [Stagnimonas sp.]